MSIATRLEDRLSSEHHTASTFEVRLVHSSCLGLLLTYYYITAMSDRYEKYCRDFRDGQACTCECFTPPADPNAPYYCRECQHGFSKHPEALETKTDTSLRQDNTESSAKTRLLTIFKQNTSFGSAEGAFKLPAATSSKSMLKRKTPSQPQLSIEQARDEVMKGFRTGVGSQSGNATKVNKVCEKLQLIHV